MTIRERLAKQRKPYVICAIVANVICLAGGALIFTTVWGLPHTQRIESQFSLRIIAGFILSVAGCAASLAAIYISLFKSKCPRCGKQLGWVPKKWNHCHFCGVSLDSQLEGTK
jgi:hypothetical protein